MSTRRNTSVDAAKLFFAFGVVLIHLAPNQPNAESVSQSLVIFCVPFFITIAVYYFIRRALGISQRPDEKISNLHLDRLWVPYLSWTVIYVALRLVKYRWQHQETALNPLPVLLYGGSAVQLYFLPFLLLCEAWALSLILLIGPRRRICLASFLFLAAAFYCYIGSSREYFGFHAAFQTSWLFVGTALLLGWVQSSAKVAPWNAGVSGILVLLLLLGSLFPDHFPDWFWYASGPVAGYAISSVMLALPSATVSSRFGQYVLGCSYGIYLAHHVFIEAFEFFATWAGYTFVPYGLGEKLLVALFVSVCCLLLITVLRMSSRLKYLLLGEPRAPVRSCGSL